MKNIFFILSFVFLGTDVYAQISTTLKMITGKEWHIQLPKESNLYPQGRIYSDNEVIRFMIADGERYEKSALYYLSDTPVVQFDEQKVGKNKSGKYIVMKAKVKSGPNRVEHDKIYNYEIMTSTENTLIVKNLANNFIITYIAKQ